MPDARDLTDRVALVTGGAGGLGRAICLHLAGRGATVQVADVDRGRTDETVRLVTEAGGSATALELDITDAEAVDRAVEGIAVEHGPRFDCLVNNAGTDRGAHLPDVDSAQWHGVFGVNVHGPMYLSRAFVRHLEACRDQLARPADIVNVVSISALTVGAGAGAYNASKAALLKFSEVLQTEARERDWPARVSIINPAAMNTPMMDQWGLPEERMMDPATVAGLIGTAISLPPEVVLQSLVVTLRNEYYPR